MVRPGARVGYQEVIDRFHSESGIVRPGEEGVTPKPPDKSAFCRSRKKIPLDVFQAMFDRAVETATEQAGRVEACRWRGFRVLAIDGTKKNMPRSEALADYFGVPIGAHFPQMLVCTLFDVLAKVPIDLVWGPYYASEREMARVLFEDLGPEDLLLLDRGFPSFELLSDLVERGTEFLVRLPKTGMFSEVGRFLATGRTDGIVTIAPPDALVQARQKAGEPVPEPLTLRIVHRKPRKRGQPPAVFITSLRDADAYPAEAISDLYHLRWEEEEFYKLVKELLESENFRGQSVLFVNQELMAMFLFCVLARILILQCAEDQGVPPATIAQKHAFLAVTRYLDRLLTASTAEECRHLIEACLEEISWRSYKKRPGRSFPRRSKSSYGKWGRKGSQA